ncbi:uncharacterized protein LOC129919608 [Episyrphus balteatus]|uniref:uncharacterized protein LOC129919608 n=1 Tax=Episyrphus balteatus TaxID=286459 RepID=UPI0024854D45|nr:uncharacterized protein LOC129919608 [Episyrphus balteatus]
MSSTTNKNNNDNPNTKLVIPEWIKEDYFQGILEKDHPDFKRIVRFAVIAATGPGENYTSIMVRVNIDIELKNSSIINTSYILKTTLPSSKASELLEHMSIFPKEKEVYQNILSQFEQLYKEVGKTVNFGPQCKLTEDSPERTTIVMEDLRQKKFKNVDRCLGLDMQHMEEVLKKLAEFHAASAVHYERFGPFSEHFTQSFFKEENMEFFEEHGEVKRQQFLEALKKWGGCEKYLDLWPSYRKVLKWFIEHEHPAADEFAVLNHGDCWSNNIMFQYNDQGQIQQTYFVDFQMCKWGTPAQDLYYLITSSAALDIKVAEFDKMMRIYQKNLADNLKLLNYQKPIPTLKDIHIIMIKYSLWGYFTGINTMIVVLLDPNENANIETYMNDEDFQKQSLMNPRYVKAMKLLLPWWENRGVFE